MPDTPIDLSEGIQSVRLKVPTAEVPIPPEGFAQLHSPAPGELALRLPDGSVVALGGGGGPPETPFMLLGSGGTVDTSADMHGVGVTIAAGVDKTIRLAAPLVDADFNPLGTDAVKLAVRAEGPDLPSEGYVVFWFDDNYNLRVRDDFDGTGLNISGGGNAKVRATPSSARLEGGGPAQVYADVTSANVRSDGHQLALGAVIALWQTSGNPLLITGLPAADPHVAGQLWVAPITNALMVSAG